MAPFQRCFIDIRYVDQNPFAYIFSVEIFIRICIFGKSSDLSTYACIFTEIKYFEFDGYIEDYARKYINCTKNKRIFTRGQLWPLGIAVASVCLCVRPSMRQPVTCPR